MKTKHYFFATLLAVILTGCYDDDKLWDVVNQQTARIEALESWQKETNSNIQALQTLVSTQDYITQVTPVTLDGDTVGYTIAFKNNKPISIYHGEKGEQGIAGTVPAISATQEADGNWYWTLNGALMKDASGNPVRANGQTGTAAPTPLLKTGKELTSQGTSGHWIADAAYLSVNNGASWTKVSGNDGTSGDSMFSDVDTSEKDYVVFKLSNGTVIRVPRYKSASLELTPPATRPGNYTTGNEPIPWNGPWLWGSSATVTCRINYPAGSTHRVEIIPPKGWKAELNTAETELTITAPGEADLSTADYEGKIIVMLHVDDNPAIIRTLDVKLTDAFQFQGEGQIANLLIRLGYKGSSLTIFNTNSSRGKMSQEDFDALKANTTIKALDLRQVENTELPADAFRLNQTLQTILLPEGLTTIGKNAFNRCSSLREIEIPQNVTIIPLGAFRSCNNLQKVTLPQGLERIEGTESPIGTGTKNGGAFDSCTSLTDINIPSTCQWIGAEAFAGVGFDKTGENLPQEVTLSKDIVLHYLSFYSHGMTKLYLNTGKGQSYRDGDLSITIEPAEIFSYCEDLKEVVIGEGVTRSPGNREDFRRCTKLETVTLPSTFTTLHPGMFADCTSLKTIIWPISKADVNAITIEEGPLSDVTENVGPFHNANPDFKIYVTGDCVTDMQSKFPTLAAHFFPIQ